MAEAWRPQAIEVYRKWIEDILTEASDDLSDWESTFIADISMKLDSRYNLTERQAHKLESIYAAKTK